MMTTYKCIIWQVVTVWTLSLMAAGSDYGAIAIPPPPGQESQNIDIDHITTLMNRLADHSVTAQEVLDPELHGQERSKSADYFTDSSYELTFSPTGPIKFDPNNRATAPVRVHFKNSTSTIDANVEVHFVRRGNGWYFANFGFLGWPLSVIVVLVLSLSLPVLYATVGLILLTRLRRQDKLWGANLIKVFIPIFWPKLFAETRASVDQQSRKG